MFQYLLRRIPAEEFAVYPVVTAMIVFAPIFFTLFSGGISRYIIDAYAQADFEGVSRIVSSILPLLTLAALAFLLIGLVFALNVESVLNIAPNMVAEARLMMSLLVISYAVQMTLQPIATAGFQVRQLYVELNLLGVLRDLIRISLLLILLLGVSANVLWVVVATVASDSAYLIATVFRSRQMVPELRFTAGLFEMKRAKTLMSFGLWTTVGRLGSVMYINAATIILNLFGTPIDVTSFYIGATFFKQLQTTINTALLPLQPALTAMNALQDRVRLASTVYRAGRYALWSSLIIAVPLAVYSGAFVDLYVGSEYPYTATVIVLLMSTFPFTQPTVLLAMASMATARVREFFLPAFLFQLAGLGLMLLFSIQLGLGAAGVALALATITVGSQVFYFWRFCLNLTNTSFGSFGKEVLLRGLAPAATGLVAWEALNFIYQPSSWFQLGGCAAFGGAIYLATLFSVGLAENDRRDLVAQLARVRLPGGQRNRA